MIEGFPVSPCPRAACGEILLPGKLMRRRGLRR